MSSYIGWNDNRFYTALESSFGTVATVSATNRCSGLALAAQQQTIVPKRNDKTGTRTYQGVSGALRRNNTFKFRTYVTAAATTGQAPSHGPLYQSALGGTPVSFGGVTVASISGATVNCGASHGLQAGQAVTLGGEIRFVAAVPSASSIVVNAPFSSGATGGAQLGATVSYAPDTDLPSLSLYDYWSPDSAVHRLLAGAAVDKVLWKANGDFHEVEFDGVAVDVLDSTSFQAGQGGLAAFPAEPAMASFDETPIPGFVGQIWIGSTPAQMLTVTEAEVALNNHLDTRNHEFGSLLPRCLTPGEREVTVAFRLFEQDDAGIQALYQAARQRTPMSFFLQMGNAAGELCGIWISRFVADAPEYEEMDTRLTWRFRQGRAEGTVNDEIYVAFG